MCLNWDFFIFLFLADFLNLNVAKISVLALSRKHKCSRCDSE